MSEKLTLDALQASVRGSAAAFRCRTEYQPAGGLGDTVFPSTYEKGEYAVVGAREENGRRLADRVLLDSVQSQANRMEAALLEAREAGRIPLPVIAVDFAGRDLEKPLRVTSLEVPHRIADALIRDSLLDGRPFRKSPVGSRLDHVDVRNATVLFELCPTTLVFGMWDSTGPKGGLGAKIQRALVSEIVGFDVQIGVRTSSRIDPAQIKAQSAQLYAAANEGGFDWTLDSSEASKDKKGNPILFNRGGQAGQPGKPSKANHGNVTPTIADGGVTISRALQTTTLSLVALRRLRFPLAGAGTSDTAVNEAARTALAALGLCAAALAREQGCDLRSRCQLFPTTPIVWELLETPGAAPRTFEVPGDAAADLFAKAVGRAREAGLPWLDEELVLTPAPQLVELVRRSQQLAASGGDEGDE